MGRGVSGDPQCRAALALRFRSSRTGSALRSGSRAALPGTRLATHLLTRTEAQHTVLI